ncbi:potassium-transporting ATPase subunit KdpC [Stenotrophomonas sp. CFBP 13725]|uniref:potassium-transporting ATPase subunit KdpC n=1 Tax=Stenotrophomonas sp. CFBP 13725 TaxID=2775297 RepID=UPI0017830781|nr:potassium-transporting ATPase subunit KdpC [Stenotrophomonas sp. CFBP 13725]MBD8637154.1 potassium-transporting ATPase subunit KdpC [Stenotrophomonas sp. CFBP 13725]
MNRSMMTPAETTAPARARARAAAEREARLQHDAPWRPAVVLGLGSLLLAGALYAGVGTGLARLAFPAQSDGSLLHDAQGTVRGSALLAQPFVGDGWFQTRPSAASHDPMAAAGSNMARSNPALAARVAEATAAVAAREGIPAAQVPADLVTQSGSGLDPDLSPAAVQVQVARVAHARGLSPAAVQALVDAQVQAPRWGLFGQPRINVMRLNQSVQAAAHAR